MPGSTGSPRHHGEGAFLDGGAFLPDRALAAGRDIADPLHDQPIALGRRPGERQGEEAGADRENEKDAVSQHRRSVRRIGEASAAVDPGENGIDAGANGAVEVDRARTRRLLAELMPPLRHPVTPLLEFDRHVVGGKARRGRGRRREVALRDGDETRRQGGLGATRRPAHQQSGEGGGAAARAVADPVNQSACAKNVSGTR